MSERLPVNRQQRRAAQRAEGHRQARERGQVTPDELKKGHYYIIPSHGGYPIYRVVSVGRKWLICEKNDRLGDKWSRWKVLKSGWDGPYFLEVDAPA